MPKQNKGKEKDCPAEFHKWLHEFYAKLQSHNDVTWRAWAQERLERLEGLETLQP